MYEQLASLIHTHTSTLTHSHTFTLTAFIHRATHTHHSAAEEKTPDLNEQHNISLKSGTESMKVFGVA